MISSRKCQPMWWLGMNMVAILVSIVFVMYPPLRRLGGLVIPFDLIFVPLYFILYIRRERSSGNLDIPIGELYRRVRVGQRLRGNSLEALAAILLFLANICIAID